MQRTSDDDGGSGFGRGGEALYLVEAGVEARMVGVGDGGLDNGVHVLEVAREDTRVGDVETTDGEPNSTGGGDDFVGESEIGRGPAEVDGDGGGVSRRGGEDGHFE